MAQPIVIQEDSGLGSGIQQASNVLAQALMTRQDRARQQQQGQALYGAVGQGYQDPSALAQALQAGGVDPSIGMPLIQNAINNKMKMEMAQAAAASKPTPAQKRRQEKAVDYVDTTMKEGHKALGTQANIDRLRELEKGLRWSQGGSTWNWDKAAEFDSRAIMTIEPSLKVFNPTGVIPQQKLDMLKTTQVPSASDSRSVIKGKLDAIEAMNKHAIAKLKKVAQLEKKYGEDIPYRELLKLDADSEKLVDQILSNNGLVDTDGDGTPEAKRFAKPPSAKGMQGKVLTNTETGEKLISNGNRWVKYGG